MFEIIKTGNYRYDITDNLFFSYNGDLKETALVCRKSEDQEFKYFILEADLRNDVEVFMKQPKILLQDIFNFWLSIEGNYKVSFWSENFNYLKPNNLW